MYVLQINIFYVYFIHTPIYGVVLKYLICAKVLTHNEKRKTLLLLPAYYPYPTLRHHPTATWWRRYPK